jgi:hypothetical protein
MGWASATFPFRSIMGAQQLATEEVGHSMRRIAIIVAVSWFFVVEGPGGFTVAVVGPFESRDQCDRMLSWLQAGQTQGRRFSNCWENKTP